MKMKRPLAGLLAVWMLGWGAVSAWADCLVTGEPYGVGAQSAVVMEAQSGEVLFAQNAQERLPMASTTKIMTALLALEQEDLDLPFVVDPHAIQVEGSSMGLTQGDTATLRALAGGMLMASGNDGAHAAAVRISGSLEGFAQLMNQRASQIGMNNTHFVTPSGLDAENHYSTAYDMALLGREALKNPLFAEMCGSKRLRLTYGNPPYDRSLLNHNRLLSLYPDAIGIKTGFTKKSGRCLVSAARRDGVTLICVTLGCGDDWNVHKNLYERYFPLVAQQVLLPPEGLEVPVTGGTGERVPLIPTQECSWTVIQRKELAVTTRAFAPNFLYAPVKSGDIVGKLVYYINDQPVGESPLAAARDVPQREPAPKKSSWWARLWGG